MEKTYFSGLMQAKHGMVSFEFISGPYKLPGETLAFMANMEGAWTGLGSQEAMFYEMFINSIDSGFDFPTVASTQLYGTINGKTDRINARLNVCVKGGEIHVGIEVDGQLQADTTLNASQIAGMKQMLSEIKAHFNRDYSGESHES